MTMLRKRDFILLMAAIGTLTLAIAGVLYFDVSSPFAQSASVFVATDDGEETSAVIIGETAPDRESRLEALRKKIAKADGGELAAATPLIEDTPTETPPPSEAEPTPVEEPNDAGERRCDNYHQGGFGWNANGLLIDEVEGGRLIYREAIGEPLASSTEPTVTRDVVLELPVRSVPYGNPQCIASDVIGIATDGSLIRNNEIGVYQVFSADSLVGYALDGFPIYGRGSAATDECGGRISGGQYRYELSSNRDVMISCYAGTPVAI